MEKFLQMLKEKLGSEVITESVEKDFKAELDLVIAEQVSKKTEREKVKIAESFKKDAEEFKNEFIEKIDSYLDYSVKEFFKENAVAIESEFKVKAAEELIEKFATILETNHFSLTPAKAKLVEKATQDSAKADAKLNNVVRENLDLRSEITEYKKALKFQKLTEGLSKVKTEKILDMLEGVAYSNIDDFERKTKIIIEKVTKTQPARQQETITEKTEISEKNNSPISKWLK